MIDLVLAPGLACTAALWRHQIEGLGDGARVLVADFTRDDTIAAMAARLLAEAPARFALAGLSMGGYVAFEVMRRAPERVTHLALIGTQARPDTPDASTRRLEQIAIAEAGGFERLLPAQWERLVARSRLDDTALRETVDGMARRVGAAAFIAQQRAIMSRADSRPDLPTIRCPSMVIVGDDDRVTPQPLAEEMAAAIPDATLHVVASAGHLTPLECPEPVNKVMHTLLAR